MSTTPTQETEGTAESAAAAASAGSDALLSVHDLKIHFPIRSGLFVQRQIGAVRAVDGVSFAVGPGETLGLVGESGCGKSTTGRGIVRLLSPTSGSIQFNGREIAKLKPRQLRSVRRDVQ